MILLKWNAADDIIKIIHALHVIELLLILSYSIKWRGLITYSGEIVEHKINTSNLKPFILLNDSSFVISKQTIADAAFR